MPDLNPDLVEGYGLRPLSAEEQRIFPGFKLILDVFKARLTASIPILFGTQASRVLWLAETYSGQHCLVLPGGSRPHVEYHDVRWNVSRSTHLSRRSTTSVPKSAAGGKRRMHGGWGRR